MLLEPDHHPATPTEAAGTHTEEEAAEETATATATACTATVKSAHYP